MLKWYFQKTTRNVNLDSDSIRPEFMNFLKLANIDVSIPQASKEIEHLQRGYWSTFSEEAWVLCKCCESVKPRSFFTHHPNRKFPDRISSVCFNCLLDPERRKVWKIKKQAPKRAMAERIREQDLKDSQKPKPKYSDYIQSDQWKHRKDKIKSARDRRCEICRGTFFPIHGHHIRYVRLGREKPRDIAFICAACHAAVHLMSGKNRREYPIAHFRKGLKAAIVRAGLKRKQLVEEDPKRYAMAVVKFFGVGNHLFLRGLL